MKNQSVAPRQTMTFDETIAYTKANTQFCKDMRALSEMHIERTRAIRRGESPEPFNFKSFTSK